MRTKTKKILAVVGILSAVLLAIAGAVFVIPRLSTTTETVAPTAPESQPAAAEWLGGATCTTSFTIAGEAPTPTPTPTEAPTSITCDKVAQDSSGATATNVSEGQEINYKITVSNTGSVTARGIVIKDVISSSMPLEYVSGDTDCNFDSDAKEVECQIENIDAGKSVIRNFKVTITDAATSGQKITNKCSVTADNVTAPTECSVDITVIGPTPTPTPTGITVVNTPTPTPTTVTTVVNTPTPTTATVAELPTAEEPTATPTPRELPSTGISLPTIGAMGGGVVMILLGILLAL